MTETAHHQNQKADKTVFGFWVYIMSDCLIFACLFATYAVLRGNTAGGPAGRDLFSIPFVLAETLILLASSFTMGLAIVSMYAQNVRGAIASLAATALLGASFVYLEIGEFARFIAEGHGPQASGFLSSFFTLVGTHGLHVSFGLLWMLVLMIQIARRGFTPTATYRLVCLSLFWHFLDIIWIFIFSIVYLFGIV